MKDKEDITKRQNEEVVIDPHRFDNQGNYMTPPTDARDIGISARTKAFRDNHKEENREHR